MNDIDCRFSETTTRLNSIMREIYLIYEETEKPKDLSAFALQRLDALRKESIKLHEDRIALNVLRFKKRL